MKKTFFLFISILSATSIFAQEPADALRYSWQVPGGTARQQAIGGAMGSLGGDITATFVNPAGLAFYKTGDFVLSPFYRFDKSKASYLNHAENAKDHNVSLGTSGFVIGSGTNRKGRNVAFSIALNRNANFNNYTLYRGVNKQSSYSQKFLEEIKNIKNPNDVAGNFPFGTSLAFNTFWIDTVAGGSANNYQFQSRAANLLATGLIQENKIESKGGIYEFALGGGVSLSDKLMLGGTFGIPILNYERDATFTEADATSNTNNKFNYASITENLSTKGAGFNVKAGLIFKPVEYVRLGLAFHSPTVYSLKDIYTTSITTDTENYEQVQSQTSDFLNGNTPGSFQYMLITPYRFIASASYVLREIEDVTKQKGFITADLEYVNYKASSYQPDGESINDQSTKDYLKNLNTAIDNAYKSAFNFKLGGELKFTTIMARAGVAYYGNPYKKINGDEKGSKLNLSAGLGYRNKGRFIDLTYIHAINKDVNYAYRLQSAPYVAANINATVGNVLLTVGFKF